MKELHKSRLLAITGIFALGLISSANAWERNTAHTGVLGGHRAVKSQAKAGQGASRQVTASGPNGASRTSTISGGDGSGYQRNSSSTGALGGTRSVQTTGAPGQGANREVTRTGPDGATETRDVSVPPK